MWRIDDITEEQYLELRKQVEEYFPEGVKCTCDECIVRLKCFYAADPYNSDGDCLMEK